MPTSPNSLISTAVSARSGFVRRRLSSDVLPAPRKPVRMFAVTGPDGAAVILPTPLVGLAPRPRSKCHAGCGARRARSRLPSPQKAREACAPPLPSVLPPSRRFDKPFGRGRSHHSSAEAPCLETRQDALVERVADAPGKLLRGPPQPAEIVDHQRAAGVARQREAVCPFGEREAIVGEKTVGDSDPVLAGGGSRPPARLIG